MIFYNYKTTAPTTPAATPHATCIPTTAVGAAKPDDDMNAGVSGMTSEGVVTAGVGGESKDVLVLMGLGVVVVVGMTESKGVLVLVKLDDDPDLCSPLSKVHTHNQEMALTLQQIHWIPMNRIRSGH